MALYSTLASLSQTAASNAADGSVDAPSTIDQQTNLLASFIAQLRDGVNFANGVRGSVSGVLLVNTNTTLVAADVGKFLNIGTTNLTITLPASSTISTGATFYFRGAAKYTLLRASTDTITTGTGTALTSAPVYGASIVIWSGTEWQVQVGGDGASLGTSGYQRFPSGLIMQWGTNVQTLNASSDGSVTFPVAYSTVYTVTACNGDTASTTVSPTVTSMSTSGFNFKFPAAGAIAVRTNWTAFGLA
jgi:hypothetical protein